MIILKITGSVIVIFACMQFGISKSASFKIRRDVLQKINIALENLSIEIRLKRGELHPLFKRLFCNQYIDFEDNRFIVSKKFLEKAQLDKLNELAAMLGKSDADGECKIISLYQSIFSEYLCSAEKEYQTNRKLWNTLSFGAGVTIVLLLV